MKKIYFNPDVQVLPLAIGESIMAGSPQGYSETEYDWSGDGYITED